MKLEVAQMNRNLIIGLDCLLGRRLIAVQKLVRANKESSAPLEIGLVFDDDFYGTFLCDADSSLAFFGDSISPLLMGEYGDYIVEDIFRHPVFSKVMGRELMNAFLIESQVEKTLVGVKFVFSDNTGLNILNVAGKLNTFSRIPQEVRIAWRYRLVPLR